MRHDAQPQIGEPGVDTSVDLRLGVELDKLADANIDDEVETEFERELETEDKLYIKFRWEAEVKKGVVFETKLDQELKMEAEQFD